MYLNEKNVDLWTETDPLNGKLALMTTYYSSCYHGRLCNHLRPSVCLSVCLSVCSHSLTFEAPDLLHVYGSWPQWSWDWRSEVKVMLSLSSKRGQWDDLTSVLIECSFLIISLMSRDPVWPHFNWPLNWVHCDWSQPWWTGSCPSLCGSDQSQCTEMSWGVMSDVVSPVERARRVLL